MWPWLSDLTSLSVPHFSHLWNGDNSYFIQKLRIRWKNRWKPLAHHLPSSSMSVMNLFCSFLLFRVATTELNFHSTDFSLTAMIVWMAVTIAPVIVCPPLCPMHSSLLITHCVYHHMYIMTWGHVVLATTLWSMWCYYPYFKDEEAEAPWDDRGYGQGSRPVCRGSPFPAKQRPPLPRVWGASVLMQMDEY